MATEIERKFLVSGDDWQHAPPIHYCQGYLNREHDRTVRVRVAGEQAYLTIKGPTSGATRLEFEYAIPAEEAKQLLDLCQRPVIEKLRREVKHAGMTWEVDEFLGENKGLVVAEIELKSEDQRFELPEWVGREVTDDPRYYNSNLSSHPFSQWKDGTA